MTPYQKAGFNELTLFRATSESGGLKIGEIHWLAEDQGDLCPMVSTRNNDGCYSQVPGHETGATCEELPKDADGFYLWDGGECPVPGDWAVQVKTRQVPIASVLIRRADEWSWASEFNPIIAFKPISRPAMPSVVERTTEEPIEMLSSFAGIPHKLLDRLYSDLSSLPLSFFDNPEDAKAAVTTLLELKSVLAK